MHVRDGQADLPALLSPGGFQPSPCVCRLALPHTSHLPREPFPEPCHSLTQKQASTKEHTHVVWGDGDGEHVAQGGRGGGIQGDEDLAEPSAPPSQIDLYGDVDERTSKATVQSSSVEVKINKKTPGAWPGLKAEGSADDIKARRTAALVLKAQNDTKAIEDRKEKRRQDDDYVFHKQWDLEKDEKRTIERLAAEHKRDAEKDLYAWADEAEGRVNDGPEAELVTYFDKQLVEGGELDEKDGMVPLPGTYHAKTARSKVVAQSMSEAPRREFDMRIDKKEEGKKAEMLELTEEEEREEARRREEREKEEEEERFREERRTQEFEKESRVREAKEKREEDKKAKEQAKEKGEEHRKKKAADDEAKWRDEQRRKIKEYEEKKVIFPPHSRFDSSPEIEESRKAMGDRGRQAIPASLRDSLRRHPPALPHCFLGLTPSHTLLQAAKEANKSSSSNVEILDDDASDDDENKDKIPERHTLIAQAKEAEQKDKSASLADEIRKGRTGISINRLHSQPPGALGGRCCLYAHARNGKPQSPPLRVVLGEVESVIVGSSTDPPTADSSVRGWRQKSVRLQTHT